MVGTFSNELQGKSHQTRQILKSIHLKWKRLTQGTFETERVETWVQIDKLLFQKNCKGTKGSKKAETK